MQLHHVNYAFTQRYEQRFMTDVQSALINYLKQRIGKDETVAGALSDVLNISSDAAYRRLRGETVLTINELEKISRKYDISVDKLFNLKKKRVVFDYEPLENYTFNMVSYLSSIRNYLQQLNNQENPKLIVTINNTPFFQLFNFPYLIRFKLYFWAKTHLQMKEFQGKKFAHQSLSPKAHEVGYQALQLYNRIPSIELYDPELLRGFAREIYFYYNAQEFEDPKYAIWLYNKLLQFIDHLKAQAKVGKKFIVGTEPPAHGCDFSMYHNETLNAITSFHYSTDQASGLFLAHNFMNSLHTNDPGYVEDSKRILDCLISNSSKISSGNEKGRNHYFQPLIREIENYKSRILFDLEK